MILLERLFYSDECPTIIETSNQNKQSVQKTFKFNLSKPLTDLSTELPAMKRQEHARLLHSNNKNNLQATETF